MPQQYGLNQQIEKPLLVSGNSMDVRPIVQLSNWLYAWLPRVSCLRAAMFFLPRAKATGHPKMEDAGDYGARDGYEGEHQ
jgi:hypothetical protein